MRDRNGDGVLEDAAGHRVSFTLKTNSDNGTRIAMDNLIRDDLAKVGIDVVPEQVEFKTLITNIRNDFDYDAINARAGQRGAPGSGDGGQLLPLLRSDALLARAPARARDRRGSARSTPGSKCWRTRSIRRCVATAGRAFSGRSTSSASWSGCRRRSCACRCETASAISSPSRSRTGCCGTSTGCSPGRHRALSSRRACAHS